MCSRLKHIASIIFQLTYLIEFAWNVHFTLGKFYLLATQVFGSASMPDGLHSHEAAVLF